MSSSSSPSSSSLLVIIFQLINDVKDQADTCNNPYSSELLSASKELEQFLLKEQGTLHDKINEKDITVQLYNIKDTLDNVIVYMKKYEEKG